MKLLINTSTLSASGVTQVSVSFLNECKQYSENEYHVFLSTTVEKEIDKTEYPSNFYFYTIASHPLYGVVGFKIRRHLRKLCSDINPDCVFSVFGPSFWTPKVPHLMGYAYPHYVYPESPLFKKINLLSKIDINIKKVLHLFFLKRNGSYYVTETKDVTSRLIDLLKINKDQVFTVNNTYNTVFNTYKIKEHKFLSEKTTNEFRFLSLCTFAVHKNLEILNKVIPLLNKECPDRTINFVLTVDEKLLNENIDKEVRGSIINLGRIRVDECPQLYSECDALFLPTTLECFSANYPEAMKMKKPILTSNLSFATGVCGDAALYFDPFDEYMIVEKIKMLLEDKNLQKELIKKGDLQLQSFLKPEQRAIEYLKICKKISSFKTQK